MFPLAGQIFLLQIQQSQRSQVLGPNAAKLVQDLPQRFAFVLLDLSEAVKGLERTRLASLQNQSHAWHPVGALGADQVAHYIECAPCIVSLVVSRPNLGQSAEQLTYGCRCAAEKRDCVGQAEFGWT